MAFPNQSSTTSASDSTGLGKALGRMRSRRQIGLIRVVAALVVVALVAIAYYRDTRRTEPDAARDVYLSLMPDIAEQLMLYPFIGDIFDKQPLHRVGDYLYARLIPRGLTPETLERLRVACHNAALETLPKDERPYYDTPGYWSNWSGLAGPVRYEALAASVRKVVLTHVEFRRHMKTARETDLDYVRRLGHLVGLANLDRSDLDGLAEQVALEASFDTPPETLVEAFEDALADAR